MKESNSRLSTYQRDSDGNDPLVCAVDEYLARIESGEQVDVDEFVQRYPELGDELRNCLEGLDLVARVAPDVSAGESNTGDQPIAARNVGDFRIIREIGRGGMGVVYEAEQLSLGRNVALKVLPYAAMMDQKAITRFKNEARAAATLDHPNIVPVFGVGNERGIYYYAMSLIDGLTMADLISHLQHSITDSAESSARLSIDDFVGKSDQGSANSGSVSHLEPTIDSGGPTDHRSDKTTVDAEDTYRNVQAAISTQRSRFDQPYFRSVARLGADAAEALEHAHQHGIVHRDIKPGNLMIDGQTKLWITDFGLARIESDAGMTMTGDLVGTLRYMAPEQALAKRIVIDHRADLYALGATLYELLALRPAFDGNDRESLLRQIAFEDPQRLRHLNRSVPEDLQTIVHKALAKNPDDRYQNAEEMASDLLAFVADEPIKARPLSLSQRASRWAIKRKGLVASVAGVLVLLVVGLLINNATIKHERNVAEEQRTLAEANAKAARETVDQYLMKVSEDVLIKAPNLEPLRKELLELALTHYQEFVRQNPESPERRDELAAANQKIGDISREMGSPEAARQTYGKAIAIWGELAATNPVDVEVRRNLAVTKARLGLVQVAVEDRIASLREAITIFKGLNEEFPHDVEIRLSIAGLYNNLSLILNPGRGFLSRQFFEQSKDYRENQRKILEALADQHPDDDRVQEQLGLFYTNARHHLRVPDAYHEQNSQSDQLMKGAAQIERGIAINQGLLDRRPNDVELQRLIAGGYTALALTQLQLKNREPALHAGQRAVDILSELLVHHPADALLIRKLSGAHDNLNAVYGQMRDHEKALEQNDKSIKLLSSLRTRFPTISDYQLQLAVTYYNRCTTYQRLKRYDEALDVMHKASDLGTALYPGYLCIEAYLCLLLNKEEKYRNVCSKALERFSDSKNPNETRMAAWTCAIGPGLLDDYSTAIEMLERSTEANPTLNVGALALLLHRDGKHQRAIDLQHKVLNEQDTPSNPSGWFILAMMYQANGNETEARAWLSKATRRYDEMLDSAEYESIYWYDRLWWGLIREEALERLGNDGADSQETPQSRVGRPR